MSTFRVALAQINTVVGDIQGNLEKILHLIEQARSTKASLVAFPELAVPGYPPEDLLFKASFITENIQATQEIVSASNGIATVVGFADKSDSLYNAAALGYNGQMAGIYHKIHLPNYGVFDEKRYFEPGSSSPVFDVDGIKIGINICEDIWHEDGPTNAQCAAGADLIVNINGSPYSIGKRNHRENIVTTRAADNGLCIAYANMTGGQDDLVFDGGSMICNQHGDIIRAKQFEEELLVVDINLDDTPSNILKHSPTSVNVTSTSRHTKKTPIQSNSFLVSNNLSQMPTAPLEPEAEIYNALVMGTRDYVLKNGFPKVVIGLSGGIDSSITACIAVDALGKEKVLGVALPSRFTSDASTNDANLLCENLGIELWTLPIEPAHVALLDMLSPYFTNAPPNIAEENIQARIRGNILMSITNKFGWMVLTTGNKSELATGYATLYGDMAGGFAVIKDVPKTMVYKLSYWRNSISKNNPVIPNNILEKAPTAELRPDQKDEDSLPRYEVLDPILEEYVEKDCSYQDLIRMGHDAEIVKLVIRLVDQSEYKRHQSPPGIKITRRNFGKDRRIPIVNKYQQF
jgi:NAD+ synthase (glutamine-hydrolysing)